AAVFCLGIFLIQGAELDSNLNFWIFSLSLALGPQLIGHGSMNYAVKYIQPTMISMSILVEPLVATLAAIVLFSEIPPIASVLAMIGIATGLILAWYSRLRQLSKQSAL